MLVLKDLVVFIEPFNFSFFSVTGWGIGLDYRDIEWFALDTSCLAQGWPADALEGKDSILHA